ncbi:MAG: hypothetical protein JW795_04355, partial [Chitinivibrionales bacterium]|nr:hypothetical protein [Chitinivibrionales bacterium]
FAPSERQKDVVPVIFSINFKRRLEIDVGAILTEIKNRSHFYQELELFSKIIDYLGSVLDYCIIRWLLSLPRRLTIHSNMIAQVILKS